MSSPTTSPTILFVAGPPAGDALFREAIRRLGCGEARPVVDPASPTDGWRERGAALASALGARPTVLVAHGLAVPAAVAAALEAPPVALVLSNGPITRVDPVAAALARLASAPGGRALLERALLRPGAWLRWLASSVGLRRAVVNPYAMDRDTVALLCGPGVATPEARRATAAYLASLAEGLPDASALTCPVLLAWGDDDRLYPASEADFLAFALPGAEVRAIPGGRLFHPEERPWALADMVATLVPASRSQGRPATSLS